MDTEIKLVYSIIETLRNNEYNNDERLGERFVRDLLNKYRSDSLRKYSANGVIVNDEVFQKKSLILTQISEFEFQADLPKIIRFAQYNYGFYIEKNYFPFPIVSSESYYQYRKSFTGYQPRAKTEGNKLTLFIGQESQFIESGSETGNIIKILKEEANASNQVSIDLRAVMFNPSDADNYNWETDIYPFPSERIEELTTQLIYKEYEIMSNAKTDEIGNQRADSVRYHDNTDINQNKITE